MKKKKKINRLKEQLNRMKRFSAVDNALIHKLVDDTNVLHNRIIALEKELTQEKENNKGN